MSTAGVKPPFSLPLLACQGPLSFLDGHSRQILAKIKVISYVYLELEAEVLRAGLLASSSVSFLF